MKALIVEDNLFLSKLLKNMLSKEGWDVHLSGSWNSAKSLMSKHSFDLLVLDILLPDKKGFEVLSILSKEKINSHLKIILISGLVDKNSVFKNIPQNLKDHCTFFKKPIDEQAFLSFIQENQNFNLELKGNPLIESFCEKDHLSKDLNYYFPQNKVLDSKDLISVIFLAHLSQLTGELKITIDQKNINLVQFLKGNIIKVISNSPKSFFGILLVEHGLSLKADIETLLQSKESQKPIGQQLVEKELLSPYMLNFILKEQAKIRLSEIMSHPSFMLNITKKPEDNEDSEMCFHSTDFIEWLADSVQTELTDDFLNKFYEEIKHHSIQKSSQIQQVLINQKKFLKRYNFLFKHLTDGFTVKDLIQLSESKNKILRFLYFGLLTKSIYLEDKNKTVSLLEKTEWFLDSILKKDLKDMFAMLNLSWSADSKEFEKNCKQLIQKVHPDYLPSHASKQLKEKAEKALTKITTSYKSLKDKEKIGEKYREKNKTFVSIINQYEQGLEQINQENYGQALGILSKIENHKATPSNILLYILWAKIKITDFNVSKEEAVQIKKAIDHCPISLRTSALFWHIKALFCIQTKKYEQAIELLTKTLTVQKDFFPARKELILIKQKLIKKSQKKKGFSFFFKKSS